MLKKCILRRKVRLMVKILHLKQTWIEIKYLYKIKCYFKFMDYLVSKCLCFYYSLVVFMEIIAIFYWIQEVI